MIIDHKKINLGSWKLIEKVTIQAPFQLPFSLPDEACFIYFERGKLKLNGVSGQSVLQTDQAMTLKCGSYLADFLSMAESELCEIWVIHLPKELILTLYPLLSSGKDISSRFGLIESDEVLRSYVDSLKIYLDHPWALSQDMGELKIKELLLILKNFYKSTSIENLLGQLFTADDTNLLAIVQAHIFSDVDVKDLADLAFMSLSSFKRKFKSLYEESPARYIRKMRLAKAAELLTSGELPIASIGEQTILGDQSQFTKIFRKAYGVTPAEFRAGNYGSSSMK